MLSLAVVAAIGFTSCSDDDDGGSGGDCATLIENLEDASEDFIADPTSVEACNDLRSALQAAIDGECGTTEEIAEAQATLELLVCEE